MRWIWIHIAASLLLGAILVLRWNRPRDLHRAPPRQTAVLRWMRLVGVGTTFYAFMHVLSLLRVYGWPGAGSAPDVAFWLMIGMIGLSLWFILSEKPHAATNRDRAGLGAWR